MNKINAVVGMEGGFARQDADRPYVIGLIPIPTARQIRVLASMGSRAEGVQINTIHPGRKAPGLVDPQAQASRR